MTKKKHEELVEGLAALFDKCAPEEVRRAAAENFIESIFSAFHDGRLDEELGVVGRAYTTNAAGEFEVIILCKESKEIEK